MTEILLKSLSLNSIGLFVIGLSLLIKHFWNKRKLSRDTDIVVIDGIKESLALKLLRVRLLVAGFALAIGSVILTVFNYNQNISDFYVQLIDDTYLKLMRSAITYNESREAIGTMEKTVPLSFLSDHIASEIELWNSSELNLDAVKQGKPICVKLYELYERNGEFDMVEDLERIYSDFYRFYYGEGVYSEKINTRESIKQDIKQVKGQLRVLGYKDDDIHEIIHELLANSYSN